MQGGRMAALAAMVIGMASATAAQAPQPSDSIEGGGHGRHGAASDDVASPRGHHRRWRALFHGIQLTDAQQSQIRAIDEKYRSQRRALHQEIRFRSSGSGSTAIPDMAARQPMRQLIQQEQVEIRALLSPEQQRKFDQNVAQMRKRAEQRREKHWRK
jgi:Spy/CpxP family protein refolding chaperone